MCCSSTSTTTEKVPKYIEEGGKRAIARAEGIAPRTPYTAPRVAPFSGDSFQGFDAIRNYFGATPDTMPAATGMITDAANAGPQSISTERVVDEGGRLGAISEYMNPYLDSVLSTAMRKIDEGGAAARKRIGAGATSARAFGDARHGILERDLEGELQTARGDVGGKIVSDAFNQAMGARGSDLARMFGVDTANAGYAETALGRKMQGGIALPQAEAQSQANFLERLTALLGAGSAQEKKAQDLLDVPYLESEAMRSDEFERLAAIVSALGGVPYTRTGTSTSPDNTGLQLLGSLIPKI